MKHLVFVCLLLCWKIFTEWR